MTGVDLEDLELVGYSIAETQLIEKLCISKKDGKINFSLFSNLIYKPIDSAEFHEYTGFYIAINVLREKLGFEKSQKPGDFDILIIPYSEHTLFFDRTCAIEVKIVRPTRKKPTKSPNSNGVSQVQGLIKDGFPLVGLIHICMPEPVPEKEKQTITFDTAVFDLDTPKNNGQFMQNTLEVKIDPFPMFAVENQMKKLVSKEIPKYVGLCTIALTVNAKGDFQSWHNLDFNLGFESGYFNPNVKSETIEKVKKFWEANKEVFMKANP